MALISHDIRLKLPFIVPQGSISRRFTSTTHMGLTPDTLLKSKICPAGFLASSRRKSWRGLYRLCANNITKERDFLPGINARFPSRQEDDSNDALEYQNGCPQSYLLGKKDEASNWEPLLEDFEATDWLEVL